VAWRGARSSEREASLVETVATLKGELAEADRACAAKTDTLAAEVSRLGNSTQTHSQSSQALQGQLAEVRYLSESSSHIHN